MLRIPGFIDIGTDISGGSWQSVSNAALRGGYTSLIAAPVAEKVYTEKLTYCWRWMNRHGLLPATMRNSR